MRAREFESIHEESRLDEIGPLISIANWFADKYDKVLSAGEQKMGAGKIQKFTNQHFRAFMRFMGMNRVDWPTLTLYVVYRYMRVVMKLSDQDIMEVLNSVMIDPTVRGKKFKTLDQIRDPNKNTLLSSLGRAGANPKKIGQIIGEKMIAAAAMQQVQNHWDKQAGVKQKPSTASQGTQTTGAAPVQSGTSTASPGTATVTPAGPAAPSSGVNKLDLALSQMGASNP